MAIEPSPTVRYTDLDAGGPSFGELVEAMRELQDQFVAADPPREATLQLAATLRGLAVQLAAWVAPDDRQPAGRRDDLPGRGSALLLPSIVDEQTASRVSGRVTFRRFQLGGGGIAHGGTVALLFDEVIGRLVNSDGQPPARTAFLHTNYRTVTRVGAELRFDATVDRIDGRKRWASGRLFDGDTLVADADSLFIIVDDLA